MSEPIKIELTSEVPTEEGWYFVCHEGEAAPMRVLRDEGRLGVVLLGEHLPFDGKEEHLVRWSRRLDIQPGE